MNGLKCHLFSRSLAGGWVNICVCSDNEGVSGRGEVCEPASRWVHTLSPEWVKVLGWPSHFLSMLSSSTAKCISRALILLSLWLWTDFSLIWSRMDPDTWFNRETMSSMSSDLSKHLAPLEWGSRCEEIKEVGGGKLWIGISGYYFTFIMGK